MTKVSVFIKPGSFPVPDAIFNLFYPQFDEEYVEFIYKSKIKGEKLARLRILKNVLLTEAEGRKAEKKLQSEGMMELGYDWVQNVFTKTQITNVNETIWEVEQMTPTGGIIRRIIEKSGVVVSDTKIGEIIV